MNMNSSYLNPLPRWQHWVIFLSQGADGGGLGLSSIGGGTGDAGGAGGGDGHDTFRSMVKLVSKASARDCVTESIMAC